jgi:guanylate kinase
MNWRRRGILFVLSAPSGGGKSTLIERLRPEADFLFSVSYTTRKPRPGEVDGVHYHFVSKEEFERRIVAGDFLEHACVHGNYYGTARDTVMEKIEAGTDVLLEIDVQGAASVRRQGGAIADSFVDIFLTPPSVEELKRRLLKRGTETPEQLAVRLANAEREMTAWREYRYLVLSGSADDDEANFRAILRAERQRTQRLFPIES